MRMILDIPDDLARHAMLFAVEENRTLTDLIVEGLGLRLAGRAPTRILPVSAARGGLLPGVEWHNLEDAGREDFR